MMSAEVPALLAQLPGAACWLRCCALLRSAYTPAVVLWQHGLTSRCLLLILHWTGSCANEKEDPEQAGAADAAASQTCTI